MNHAKREEFRQLLLCQLQCLTLQYPAGLQSNMSTVLSTQVHAVYSSVLFARVYVFGRPSEAARQRAFPYMCHQWISLL